MCEGGTLILGASKRIDLWRDRKQEDWKSLPGLPKFPEFNHRHEWINTAIGEYHPDLHWSSFAVGMKITEAVILPVKATRFPGVELAWNREKLAFTKHDEATRMVVKRDHCEGFAPVRV